MGVRSAATKLHIPPSAARRPAFLPFVAVLLCSASYLLGVWQHGGFASPSNKSPAVSIATAIACTTAAAAQRKKASSTRARSRSPSQSSRPLDFSAHHAAAADEAFATAAGSSGSSSSSAAPRRYLRDRLVYRERHCPSSEREWLRCLVPAPPGYRTPFSWQKGMACVQPGRSGAAQVPVWASGRGHGGGPDA
jgi:hypothetical protein